MEFEVARKISTLKQRTLACFAPDGIDDSLRSKIYDHIHMSAYEAATIQCVGMTQPIPISTLYQPTKLKGQTSIESLIAGKKSVAIYAGPGQGKTTLLRHLLFLMVEHPKQPAIVPLFFALRTEKHTELLLELINVLDRRRRYYYIPLTP